MKPNQEHDSEHLPTVSEPGAGPENLSDLPEIEGYKILRVLGEGGMGVVYLARQKRPIQRRVALKIVKPGMDSKRIMARFEAERQPFWIIRISLMYTMPELLKMGIHIFRWSMSMACLSPSTVISISSTSRNGCNYSYRSVKVFSMLIRKELSTAISNLRTYR